MRASGAAARAVLAAIAFLIVGVWGVINLSDGDWFIGGVMLGSAVVTLWCLVPAAPASSPCPPRIRQVISMPTDTLTTRVRGPTP